MTRERRLQALRRRIEHGEIQTRVFRYLDGQYIDGATDRIYSPDEYQQLQEKHPNARFVCFEDPAVLTEVYAPVPGLSLDLLKDGDFPAEFEEKMQERQHRIDEYEAQWYGSGRLLEKT